MPTKIKVRANPRNVFSENNLGTSCNLLYRFMERTIRRSDETGSSIFKRRS
jgi:hypothetical protein